MHVAVLTLQSFNELDSLVALEVLNRIRKPGWRGTLCCPEPAVTAMNGVAVQAQSSLAEAGSADAVMVGSGIKTRAIVNDRATMSALRLNRARQLVGAQYSGTLVLAKLRMLGLMPACTDLTTKPWAQEAGVEVLNPPFFAADNVAGAMQRIAPLPAR